MAPLPQRPPANEGADNRKTGSRILHHGGMGPIRLLWGIDRYGARLSVCTGVGWLSLELR